MYRNLFRSSWGAARGVVRKLPLQSRILLSLKVTALVVIVGFITCGHPPSSAQAPSQWQPQSISPEDVRQDTDITYIKADLASRELATIAMQETIVKQGEELARLDTKITIMVGFLGLLQGGGIVLTVVPLKRKERGV